MGTGWLILWEVSGLATIIAAVLATRSTRAGYRYFGRAVVGVPFIVGGALLHVVALTTGGDYTSFADPAHFRWVTSSWHAVVAPHQDVFIGLLAAFEAIVGVLILCGRRWTRMGYAAVIAFYLALWLFGWPETAWSLVMIPPMALLLRAERRAAVTPARARSPIEKPKARLQA